MRTLMFDQRPAQDAGHRRPGGPPCPSLPEAETRSTIRPDANDVRVDLARMMAGHRRHIGGRKAARGRDPGGRPQSQVEALKLRAAWQIDGDDLVDDAIVNLRAADARLRRDDAQIMTTLMAAAHERAGEPELQREMLSLAVEASRIGAGRIPALRPEPRVRQRAVSAGGGRADRRAAPGTATTSSCYAALGRVYVATGRLATRRPGAAQALGNSLASCHGRPDHQGRRRP